MVEHRLWEPGVAGSSPVAPRARSSAGQSKGFLIPRSGVRVPPGPLLIHGWGFSSQIFNCIKGIKVDLPGHGKSIGDSYSTLQDIAIKLLKKIPEKTDIVGWSLGASIALLMSLLNPNKVNKLILIGATANFYSCWETKNIRAFLMKLKREGYSFVKEFRTIAYKHIDIPLDTKKAAKLLEDFIHLDLRPKLHTINKEVYIIHGTKDKIVPFSCGKLLHQYIKGSKFISLVGGHLPVGYERTVLEILKS